MKNKYIVASIIIVIVTVAIIIYWSKTVFKHKIWQRIQATDDLQAESWLPDPNDKTKMVRTGDKRSFKKGEIIGYLYVISPDGYWVVRKNKGYYVPIDKSRRIN